MLDFNWIKSNPEAVQKRLQMKGFSVDFTDVIQLDTKRKAWLLEIEQVKAEANRLSASVPAIKKAGGDVQAIFAQVKQLNASIQDKEKEMKNLELKIDSFLAELPNVPDEDLRAGGKENNQIIRVVYDKPVFSFPIKDHVDLAESLHLVDYQRAAKISGAGTWIYSGIGAQLEWALLNFFIQEHLKDGYQMMLIPHMLNQESGYTAGQFPKFKEDVFWMQRTEP